MIFPGGFGAAKNLSNLAFEGADFSVEQSVQDFVRAAHAAGLALGFMCIAPAIAAGALGDQAVELTIGNDPDTAAALETKGARHLDCAVDDVVVDTGNKVVTTPAYMLASNILEAEAGINKCVAKVLELA